MIALIIGATGATGKDLLEILLNDNDFEQVIVFVRRGLDIRHDKLITHTIDFDQPEQWQHLVKGDVFFSCLGTTLKAAGSKAKQWVIDYDYQYRFAQAARANQVNHYVLVSSSNASANSIFFYARMKGQLEDAVKALGFARLTIFNPPLLVRKHTDRAMETIGLKVIQFFNNIGMLHSQKPLPTEVLAQAMCNAAKLPVLGIINWQGQAIWQLANGKVQNNGAL